MPDVVSVPEAAGREALVRLLGYGQPAVAPGPVALSAGGRVLFYVADGGAQDLPELLEWLDWGGVRLDLTAVAGSDLTDPRCAGSTRPRCRCSDRGAEPGVGVGPGVGLAAGPVRLPVRRGRMWRGSHPRERKTPRPAPRRTL
ncbi:hypothetical protein ACFQ9X_01780 [Catenulispora yoronensis]